MRKWAKFSGDETWSKTDNGREISVFYLERQVRVPIIYNVYQEK